MALIDRRSFLSITYAKEPVSVILTIRTDNSTIFLRAVICKRILVFSFPIFSLNPLLHLNLHLLPQEKVLGAVQDS